MRVVAVARSSQYCLSCAAWRARARASKENGPSCGRRRSLELDAAQFLTSTVVDGGPRKRGASAGKRPLCRIARSRSRQVKPLSGIFSTFVFFYSPGTLYCAHAACDDCGASYPALTFTKRSKPM